MGRMQISLILWHVACSSPYTLKMSTILTHDPDFAKGLSRIKF